MNKGKVYLVGAGPGDPALITVKGRQILENADVVVYDNLATPLLLACVNHQAKLIYVGKKSGKHTMDQASISKLLVELAKEGLNVVRLKGGDPFIFGRGGEEAQTLFEHNIEFEIIPGVTSAAAVPAYAGIPLTHRQYASIVTFLTGHEDPKKVDSGIPWSRIPVSGTIVILMGVANIRKIKERLLENGMSYKTPFAIICNGTLPDQDIVEGKLIEMDIIAKKRGVKPPAIIIIGNVVNLRKELLWFEKKPLFGKRILITRPREQIDEIMSLLTDMGAFCIPFSTISIVPPDKWDLCDSAIANIKNYNWIIFTSKNGVKFFFSRFHELGNDIRDLKGIKIGAIGPKTAQALKDMYININFVPKEYRAEGIVSYISNIEIKGKRFLLPRAEKARDYLPTKLEQMGAEVDIVPVYKNVLPNIHGDYIEYVKKMFLNKDIHIAVFTSPSTFQNFLKLMNIDEDIEKIRDFLNGTKIACIGPVTGNVIEKTGLSINIMPERYTVSNLVDSIVKDCKKYFA